MSARPAEVEGPDAYLLGHADGQKSAAPSLLMRTIEAEKDARELRKALRASKQECQTLRRIVRARWLNSGRLAIACSALTFLATFNVMARWF